LELQRKRKVQEGKSAYIERPEGPSTA
jgi:hypothetical protein